MSHYGASWGPENSMVLSTERMRKRAIVERGLHELSPSIPPSALGSRQEQFPGPCPARLRTPVVQALGQGGAQRDQTDRHQTSHGADTLDVLQRHVK